MALNKIKSLLLVSGGAAGMFVALNIFQENEIFYEKFLMPALHKVDPEFSHNFAVTVSKYGFVLRSKYKDPDTLSTSLGTLKLNNPVGIAAGFDKQGEAVEALNKIGFGFVEVGSVTPVPQPGNDKPRVFRLLEDEAVINSPNTPGLRSLQSKHHLKELLSGVVAARDDLPTNCWTPVFLKLSPDLTDEEKRDIADVLKDPKCTIDGLIISNTTVGRPENLQSNSVCEEGGLSGRPLRDLSTNLIAEMYSLTGGKIPIIGVGGIFTGQDAYDKICAGASAVQLYTSFIFYGPPRITRIKKELDELLRINNYQSVEEAVGTKALKLTEKRSWWPLW
ncbi:dihydroorotate dehydrogenase (quinone), mitochondrial isoform X2 [Schistocerca americana]|uniref:dihydroorotate dehydrogenase (quinone), mitochondrial isoform X2 n=1 Tax=Schistocerca americana TaxID=7009 RepID=UPI001F5036DC|nr:dihydroorotate dehydrogenase (quinone), mitochondrial isoform X2 [Schistocerca americana]